MPHVNAEERAAYHRAYRERNKERLSELNRNYRTENADVLKQKKHEEYLRNADAYKARAKVSRERNVERIKAHRATPEYREERNAARRAAYIPKPTKPLLTQEEKLARKRQEYAQNRARYRETFKAYYNTHKELWRTYGAKKEYWKRKYHRALGRAYVKGAEIVDLPSISAFYKQVFTKSEAVCDYCRGLFPIREIVVEHKQPYVLGGQHAVANFAVSCSPCNLHKGTTEYEKWVSFSAMKEVT